MTVPNLFDVSGKTALVTGGSRGIGLMIARGLVQGGASVIVSSRKAADVQDAERQLGELGACQAIPGDISTPQGAGELAAATREIFPTLDILINNAVAGLTLFLASRAGAYMTGTVIPLDGGITGCG